MADAVGMIANAVAIGQLAVAIINVVRDIKDAPLELDKFTKELANVNTLLSFLRKSVESLPDNELWTEGMHGLNTENGILDQFCLALKNLKSKISLGGTGITKSARVRLTWPFIKQDVKEISGHIERLKTSILIAIAGGQLLLAQDINMDVGTIIEALKKLLQQTDQQTFEEQRECLHSIVAMLEEGLARQRVEENNIEVLKIAAWLSSFEFVQKQQEAQSLYEHDTCQGFLRSQTFSDWKEGKINRLWCQGHRQFSSFNFSNMS